MSRPDLPTSDSPGTPMRPDSELDQLLGVYALDALEHDERAEVDAYLERSPRARAEVDSHVDVASFLGNIGGEAPKALWDRIEQHLEGVAGHDMGAPPLRIIIGDRSLTGHADPSASAPASVSPSRVAGERGRGARKRRVVRMGWVTSSLTAAAAVVAVLGFTVAHQNSRLNRLSQQSYQARRVNEILSSNGSHEAVLASTDGRVHVKAVISSTGEAYVLGSQLPTLSAGRTYQLWGVKDGKVVSLGVLGRGFTVRPFTADEGWSTLAITDESTPGVSVSTRPPVVAGDVV